MNFIIDPTTDRLTPPGDVLALLELINTHSTGNILEIGCSQGLTTRDIAINFPHKKIYAVDTLGAVNSEQVNEKPNRDTICRWARHLPNVEVVAVDSQTFDFYQFCPDFDFAFIDGDHTYDGVKRDTENLVFKRPFGRQLTLAWHDYYTNCPSWCGVSHYLDYDFTWSSIHLIENTWLAWAKLPEQKN